MTKIDIISGFLGAGKTTLIKKLIEEVFTGEKLVLIENEFGEIGIDGGFLRDSGVEITEMNSGCICCSLVGDFDAALNEVLERFTPDRILIEPSGVGKLSDVIKAVMGIVEKNQAVVLNSTVTVADASKCNIYMKNFGEFYNNQIEHAKTIVLSRTQKLSDEKTEVCVREIRAHNGQGTIITTPWDELKGEKILAAMEREQTLAEEILKEEKICPACGHHEHSSHEDCNHHGHHHADDVFASWGAQTPHKYKRDELDTMLKALSHSEAYGMILRAKGIVPAADQGWLQFDMVPGEYEIREGAPDYTGRLCVIGTKLNKEAIQALFCI